MRGSLTLFVALSLAFFVGVSAAAEPPTPLKFKSGVGRVVVKGEVGGEEHDAYSFKPEAGRTVQVAISSRHGRVSFSLCDSDNYSDAEPVNFGKRSGDGKVWEGVIPVQKIYYIYVTAYPEAKYTLIVELK